MNRSSLLSTITLLAAAIGLLAARPLFEPYLVQATDSLAHFYLVVHLDNLMQQGIYYSRWLPYRISGLGEPVFQYYPPLASYVTQSFKLSGLETLLALRLTFGLTLVGGAVGVYLWVHDSLDKSSGLIAAAAYVYAPHILFNTFFRGGLTEQLALMFVPFVLWAFRRLAITKQSRYLALGAIFYAATILSHNLTALIFSPLLFLYTLVLAAECFLHFKTGLKSLLPLWIAIALGLGLTAFFWLPAIVERNAIHTGLMHGNPALDYHFHFIPLSRLFLTPWSQTVAPALNLSAVVLAAIGLFTARKQENLNSLKTDTPQILDKPAAFCKAPIRSVWGRSLEIWWAILAALACMLMVLPASVWIWDSLPLLALFQFPHRFLGLAAIFIAFLAGLGIYNLQWLLAGYNRWLPTGLLLLALVMLAASTRVLSQVRYYPPLPEIDIKFIMQKEREAAPVVGEFHTVFIPAAVKKMPPFEILARDGPDRLDLSSLPKKATRLVNNYNPLYYDLTLSSPEPFLVRFNIFYFPGWQAKIDGWPTTITPTNPSGLISLEIPAGQHHLVIWFGSTTTRRLANLISLCSIGLLLGIVVAYRHFK